MLKSTVSLVIMVCFAAGFVGCKKDDPAPTPLTATTFKNLAADPPSGGYNPTNGQPIGVTRKYTFFSFSSGAVVVNADSASTKWDIGFNGTNIIINSGTSGPGVGAAQVQSGIFDEITTAPNDGYLKDNKSATPGPLVPLLIMMFVPLNPISHLAEVLSAFAMTAPVLKLKKVYFLVTPIG